MIESIVIIIGIAVIAVIGMSLYIRFVKKEDGEDKQEQQEQGSATDTGIDLERIAKWALISLLGVSFFVLWGSIMNKDWILMIIICTFYVLLLRMCIFKVEKVYVALLESYLIGRFLPELDEYDCQQPICKPKPEGLRIKWPWWTYETFKLDNQTLVIKLQEYPIRDGTVGLEGLITGRTTKESTTRAAEMTLEESQKRLLAKADQIIRDKLIVIDLEAALKMKGTITSAIFREMIKPIKVPDPKNPGKKVPRKLWGKPVPYAEDHYALEVFEVVINNIVPVEAIEKLRNEIQGEEFKSKQLEIYLARDKMIKNTYPNMPFDDRLKALQVWSKQTTRDIKTFEVADIAALVEIAEQMFFGKKEGGEK